MRDGNGVAGTQFCHPGPHLRRRASEMRKKHDVGQVGETGGEEGLLFVHVEPGACEVAVAQAR